MRRIPLPLAALMRDLRWTAVYRRTASDQATQRAIAELGHAGHPAAIPILLDLLARPEHAAAAATALDHIIRATPAVALPGAAEHVRSDDWETWGPKPLDWYKRTISVESTHWIHFPFGAVAALTLHPSGYIREAALLRLAEVDEGKELPFLLIRLNDWVEPIRSLAARLVDARLNPAYVRSWLACAALLPLIARGQRSPLLAPRIARAQGMLRSADLREHLREAIAGAFAIADRRALFDLALSVPDADRTDFIVSALHAPDGYLRLRAAKLARSLAEPTRSAAIHTMSMDRDAPVRREAIYATLAADPAAAVPLLRRFLFDPHPSIRHAARVYLRDLEPADPRAEYLACLAARGPGLLGAVRGLGEVGRREDVEVLARIVDDTSLRPSVRAAAVEAIERLDEHHATALLVTTLRSPVPALSSAAKRILLRRGRRFSGAHLAPALNPAQPLHVRRNATRVLGTADWPSAPATLIRLATEPALAPAARAALIRLRTLRSRTLHYLATPSMEQAIRETREALDQWGPGLDPETRRIAESLT